MQFLGPRFSSFKGQVQFSGFQDDPYQLSQRLQNLVVVEVRTSC